MRLICPNCDAHYEVESRLIPENGRDVQCSSCGDTWFQAAPTDVAETSEDLETDFFAANMAESHAQYDDEINEDSVAPAPQSIETEEAPTEAPERARLDSALMDVLREEAERETQARIDEGSTDLETQTEMGLSETETVALETSPSPEVDGAVRERTARLRGIEPEDLSDGSVNSRSDLLPDIEEINSTLRATSDRKTSGASEQDEEATKTRSGFRMGFSLIIALVALLLLTYNFAPQIGAKVPAIDPALQTFVKSADQGRMQLDAFMEAIIEKIDSSEAPAQ